MAGCRTLICFAPRYLSVAYQKIIYIYIYESRILFYLHLFYIFFVSINFFY
jgi:hypothetical protein